MLTTLQTKSFRNLEDQRWEPAPGPNLVFGRNGAGKSSLLEAVYLVATTRSFRTSRLVECCRLGSDSFHLAAEVEGEERVRLEVGYGPDGKTRAVNGSTGPIVDHLSVCRVVTWTARDDEIFQGPPEVRRRLMDRGVVVEQPASLALLSEYRQAVDAKRSALDSQVGVLGEWNRLMGRVGATLVARRAHWVEQLERELNAVLKESELGLGEIELDYRPSPRQALDGEEAMVEALERLRSKELERGIPLAGPHRDDVEILWRNGPVGAMASAGERKALGLALMVAQTRLIAERRSQPVVLVDDLDSELDHRRVDQLWELLAGVAQLVAASSRKSVVSRLAAEAEWDLRDGRLERL